MVGASRGGVAALCSLVFGLPRDLEASVFLVQHTAPEQAGSLDEILSRYARLPIRYAWDGEPFTPGVIYLAPPDRHLLLEPETLRLTRGPRENGVRPAIDPLFRSAAAYHGARVVGILLTGSLSDGTAGLEAIRRSGGLAVVQHPADAAFAEMPRSALARVGVDHVLPLAEISALLPRLARERAPGGAAAPDDVRREARVAAGFAPRDAAADLPRSQATRFERSTLVALRVLEERARLLDRLAEQANSCDREAKRYARDRDETMAHAQVLRELLASLDLGALALAPEARS